MASPRAPRSSFGGAILLVLALAATLDGLGTLLAGFYHDQSARKLVSGVINIGLAHFWSGQQRKMSADHIRHLNRLDRAKGELRRQVTKAVALFMADWCGVEEAA